MKYIKIFENEHDYQTFISTVDYKIPNVSYILDSKNVKYTPRLTPLPYLTIEALEDELTTQLSVSDCEYSLDGKTWIDLPANTETPKIKTGKKLYFKKILSNSNSSIGTFTISKRCNLLGNIMSLIYGDNAQGKTDLTGYDYVFSSLFNNCDTIINASQLKLPATTLATYCYSDMFAGCTSLETAPELPAITLSDDCYRNMFYGCTSLVTAPDLLATILAPYCYSGMFRGCTSLTTAPKLPATILTENCYTQMFAGCTLLNYITMLATDISANTCLFNWVEGVASTGTFVKNDNAEWNVTGTNGVPENWEVKMYSEELINKYFTIEALENGLTAKLSNNICKYSLDGISWIDLSANTETPAINTGEKIFLKGSFKKGTSTEIGTFTFSKKCNLLGNCMSIIFGDDAQGKTDLTGYNYVFYKLFYNCNNIINVAPNFLPATTLATYCYNRMFYGCTSLETAPELPATTLTNYCYQYMFRGCTSLTTAPVLSATTLVSNCYGYMFYGCTNLKYIKALFTTTPSSSYTGYWVSNVGGNGTFVKNAAATWNVTGNNGVPSGWTVETV